MYCQGQENKSPSTCFSSVILKQRRGGEMSLQWLVNLKMSIHHFSEWLLNFRRQAGNPRLLFCRDVAALLIHSFSHSFIHSLFALLSIPLAYVYMHLTRWSLTCLISLANCDTTSLFFFLFFAFILFPRSPIFTPFFFFPPPVSLSPFI